MSALTVPNSFAASTTILSASVNANFAAVVAWAAGNIDQSNFGTLTGAINWTTTANVLNINSANSGTEGSATFAHTGVLGSGKHLFTISSSAAQTNGSALSISYTNASSAVPLMILSNAGTGSTLRATQSGVLATGAAVYRAVITGAQTTGLAGLHIDFQNASSTIPVFGALNSGSGPFLKYADNSSNQLYQVNSAGVNVYGGANQPGWTNNILLDTASASTTADTIKLAAVSGTVGVAHPIHLTVAGTVYKVTSSLSTLLTGAHMGLDGHGDKAVVPLYVYAVIDAGAVVLGISRKPALTTIVDTSTSATPASVNTYAKMLVSTSLSSGTKNCQQIGVIKAAFTDTADVWQIDTGSRLGASERIAPLISEVRYDTYAGYGGTDTKIPYFTNRRVYTGHAITETTNNSTNGLKLTVNEDGIYSINMSFEGPNAAAATAGISKNSSQLTTSIYGITVTDRLAHSFVTPASSTAVLHVNWVGFLSAGDIIRPHTAADAPVTAARCHFQMIKLS